jgi:hypothetical protein
MENRKEWKISNLLKVTIVVVALAALALGAVALAPGAAQAQEDETEDPSAPVFDIKGFGSSFGHEILRRFGGDLDYDTFLAEALSISVEQLQSAREQANAAMLEEALAKGYITEEQVELMEARRALNEYIDQEALIAEALGISAEELQAARDEHKPLSVLIWELDIDPAEVRENMQTAHENAIQGAIEAGVVTQEQVDQLQAGKWRLDSPRGFHPDRRGRGGFGYPEDSPPAESESEL